MVKELIGFTVIVVVFIYQLVYAFTNPELTQTQLQVAMCWTFPVLLAAVGLIAWGQRR